MKIKISQIKSDIQREKVGREAAGPMLVWAAAHRPLGKLSWASDPLLVSGACWASPVRLGAIRDVGWERSPPTIIGRSSQVGGAAPPAVLDCPSHSPGCFRRGLEDLGTVRMSPLHVDSTQARAGATWWPQKRQVPRRLASAQGHQDRGPPHSHPPAACCTRNPASRKRGETARARGCVFVQRPCGLQRGGVRQKGSQAVFLGLLLPVCCHRCTCPCCDLLVLGSVVCSPGWRSSRREAQGTGQAGFSRPGPGDVSGPPLGPAQTLPGDLMLKCGRVQEWGRALGVTAAPCLLSRCDKIERREVCKALFSALLQGRT